MGKNGFKPLADRAPEQYAQWLSVVGKERMEAVERQITLFQTDRLWTAYLAMIADVRESIHLVNVAGRSPIDEFHRILAPEFRTLEKNIEDAVVETFRSLVLKDGGIDLGMTGIKGPSSTWTYLVSDNPFGSWMELIKGSHIGFAAFGAFLFFPFYIAYGFYKHFNRIFSRRKAGHDQDEAPE